MKNGTKTKALMIPMVSKVVIPTKKLNFIEQKKYKEYGLNVLTQLEQNMTEIHKHEMDKFIDKNKESLFKKVFKDNPELRAILNEVNKIYAKNKEIKKTRREELKLHNREIQKMTELKETKKTQHNRDIRKLFERLEKMRDDFEKSCGKKEELSGDFLYDVDTEREYNEGDDKVLDITEFERPLTEKDLIDSDYINNQLEDLFEKNDQEVKLMQTAIKEMKDVLEEVMLFDESKLKPLFEQILQAKKKVKQKYKETFF